MQHAVIDTADLLLNLAILPAAVFIFAGVAGLNPSVAGQIVSGAAGIAGGYLASVLANEANIRALGKLNLAAAEAAVALVVYATVAEDWILFIDNL